MIAGVQGFVAEEEGVLAPALYVAMTRARSFLSIFGYRGQNITEPKQRLLNTLESCMDQLRASPFRKSEKSRDLNSFKL